MSSSMLRPCRLRLAPSRSPVLVTMNVAVRLASPEDEALVEGLFNAEKPLAVKPDPPRIRGGTARATRGCVAGD